MGMDNGVSKLEKQEQTFLFFFSFFCKEFPRLFWLFSPMAFYEKGTVESHRDREEGRGFFLLDF